MSLDLGSSLFDQLVVTQLLREREVITRQRERLRTQRDALADALRTQLPGWKFRLPEGGIALWVRLPHGSATRLAADVERVGVRLAPGPVFTVEGGADQWVRLPFTKPVEQLVLAVERMAEVWREMGALEGRGMAEARLLIA